MLNSQDRQRLETERNLWLATVRPNGSPHLVPIWFVWHSDRAYLCTAGDSVKARNIAHNPKIAFALENGDDPVLVEGVAKILDNVPAEIVAAFEKKFEWNIQTDGKHNTVIELTPTRVVL